RQRALAQMVGRLLPLFSLSVPLWVVWAMAGFRGMVGVWPAALTAGLAFAVPQFAMANFHGPWLVDIVASVCSLGATTALLKVWRPKDAWSPLRENLSGKIDDPPADPAIGMLPKVEAPGRVMQAWIPWILLSALVFVWGVPRVKKTLDGISAPSFQIAGLHNSVFRSPPIAPKPIPGKPTVAEEAVFRLNWLSATGTGIL